jgi:phospholipid/cholesterol/gamma-HCH transport system ATP-binding protein
MTPTPPLTTPFLEMQGVEIGDLHDPEKVVLRQVDWKVQAGDYWAIGGLQGSGKSNFLFAAAGVLPPRTGKYLAFGTELTAGYEHEKLAPRLRIGTIFDGGRLFHHLSIAENIALPLRYHLNLPLAEAARAVEPLLQFIGLQAEAATLLPGSLGRNWQQRAGMARALALKPDVLLFDSPLSGLDPREIFWWLDIIDKLAAGHPILGGKAATIVVTTDDLRPWANHARQFAVLKNKALVLLDGPEIEDRSSWQEEEPT